MQDQEMQEMDQLIVQNKVTNWQSVHDLVTRKLRSLPMS